MNTNLVFLAWLYFQKIVYIELNYVWALKYICKSIKYTDFNKNIKIINFNF